MSVVNVIHNNTKQQIFQSQRPSAISYSLRYDGRNTYARRSGTLCASVAARARRAIMCSSNPLRSPISRSAFSIEMPFERPVDF